MSVLWTRAANLQNVVSGIIDFGNIHGAFESSIALVIKLEVNH